jgi:hypothetical protein
MGFWFLDDKTQLALLLAGLLSAGGAAGCDDGRPVPSDAKARDGSIDWPVADMVPPDARADVPIADPLPPDAWPDSPIADMVPPDAQPDVPIADPLPPDFQTIHPRPPKSFPPAQPGQAMLRRPSRSLSPSQPGHELPIDRRLDARIQARQLEGSDGPLQLELTASCRGADPAELTYRWVTSSGTLDDTEGFKVRWTPPSTPGRHMVQVVVRDGDRAVAVHALYFTVE